MSHFLSWLEMGGYAFYVWTAYGFLFLVFIIHLLNIHFQQNRLWKKLEQETKDSSRE